MSRAGRTIAPDVEPEIDVRRIALEQLVFTDTPIRRRDGAADVTELAQSIKASGIIEPIIVRPADEDGYEVVAGERRAEAARSLGMATVPCIVRDCTDEEAVVVGIVENLQRAELNPMDRARGISRLRAFGRSQAEIGDTLGMAQSSVAHHLRLLALPEAVAEMIAHGQLSMGHGKILATVGPTEATVLAAECLEQAVSVRELERRVGSRKAPAACSTPSPTDTASAGQVVVRREERELSNGVVVVVRTDKGSPQSGRIEIPYYSEDEKEWTLDVLAGKG